MHESQPEYGEKYDWRKKRPTDLERLKDLKDWRIEEGDIDPRGYKVVDQDRRNIGEIEDLLVSTGAGRVIFLLVNYGWTLGRAEKKTLVPLDAVDFDGENKQAIFQMTPDHITSAPLYTQDHIDYGVFYDYWGGMGPIVTEQTEREMEIAGEKHGEAG